MSVRDTKPDMSSFYRKIFLFLVRTSLINQDQKKTKTKVFLISFTFLGNRPERPWRKQVKKDVEETGQKGSGGNRSKRTWRNQVKKDMDETGQKNLEETGQKGHGGNRSKRTWR